MQNIDDTTARDQVWNSVLELLTTPSPGGFRLDTVRQQARLAASQEQTVRRVLKTMEAMGYLQRESDRGHYWYPGPRARQYLRRPHDGEPFHLVFEDEEGNNVTRTQRNRIQVSIGRRSSSDKDPIAWVAVRETPEKHGTINEFTQEDRADIDDHIKDGGTAVAYSDDDRDVLYRVRPTVFWAQQEDGRLYAEDVDLEFVEHLDR